MICNRYVRNICSVKKTWQPTGGDQTVKTSFGHYEMLYNNTTDNVYYTIVVDIVSYYL